MRSSPPWGIEAVARRPYGRRDSGRAGWHPGHGYHDRSFRPDAQVMAQVLVWQGTPVCRHASPHSPQQRRICGAADAVQQCARILLARTQNKRGKRIVSERIACQSFVRGVAVALMTAFEKPVQALGIPRSSCSGARASHPGTSVSTRIRCYRALASHSCPNGRHRADDEQGSGSEAPIIRQLVRGRVCQHVGRGDAGWILFQGRAPHLPLVPLAADCQSRVCEVKVSLHSERPEWARAGSKPSAMA